MRPFGFLTTLAALLAAPAASASITGVCPDGSIFIVQRAEAIPCTRAKLVQPHEVPPVRPELLPNPYTWQVYNEGANPNNPYNLIDAARDVRALSGGPGAALPGVEAEPRDAPAPTVASGGQPRPSTLGLSDDEIRDLFLIVELSQDGAPAAFVKETAAGGEAFVLSFAHSSAFDAQLRERHPRGAELAGTPILLFSAVAHRPETFHPNFTFTQAHLAFSPESSIETQFGVVVGRLGGLQAGEVVLGWVALPGQLSLSDPLGVYWNDRHLMAVFEPL
ncbi:MAG: hypothetical protein ABFS46_09890 [Myxococcota bacterium]